MLLGVVVALLLQAASGAVPVAVPAPAPASAQALFEAANSALLERRWVDAVTGFETLERLAGLSVRARSLGCGGMKSRTTFILPG